MKLDTQRVDDYSRGVKNSTDYQVADSPELMDILSKGLYSDPIRAVIRELSTNAWDAHVMAGTTNLVPKLTLPTHSNGYTFTIRDYGTGLTVEQLETMYRTYGMSDKNNSNNFNGCMGLGSKSPFAVSDSFITTSFKDGKKYTYINAKKAEGGFKLDRMVEEDTDEPNGLQISFIVPSDKQYDFVDRAQKVLRWFPKRFNVESTGGYHGRFTFEELNYAMEGKGWKLRKGHGSSPYAIMGYVEYPIDKDQFKKSIQQRSSRANVKNDWYKHYNDGGSNVETDYSKILDMPLELSFDIGEVVMDASREKLRYAPVTIDNIKLRLDTAMKEIKEKIEEKFKDCKSYWEAACLFLELNRGEFNRLWRVIQAIPPTYNGRQLKSNFNNIVSTDYEVKEFSYTTRNRTGVSRRDNVYSMAATKDIEFFIPDMKRGNYTAIQHYVSTSKKTVFLIKAKEGVDIDTAVDTFCDKIGLLKSAVKKCSSLPKAPAKKRDKTNVYSFNPKPNLVWRDRGRNRDRKFFVNSEIDFNAGGLYFEVNNWTVLKADGGRSTATGVSESIEALEALGVKVPQIYGIKTNSKKKYEKSKNWTCFFEWAKAEFLKIDSIKKSAQNLEKIRAYEENNATFSKYCNLVENGPISIKSKDNPILKLVELKNDLEKVSDSHGTTLDNAKIAARLLGVDLSNLLATNKTKGPTNTSQEIQDLLSDAKTKYEFLDFVSDWQMNRSDHCRICIKTINIIDSCTEGSEDE